MRNKPKIIFANFGRLERLLFWNIFAEESLHISGIVSDADPEIIAKFLEFDSSHGCLPEVRFTIKNNSENDKSILIVGKNSVSIKIISPKKFTKKFSETNPFDIVVSLNPHITNLQVEKLSMLDAKAIICLSSNSISKKKIYELTSFSLNHKKINLSKNKVVVLAKIEATIAVLITKMVQEYAPVVGVNFQILRGPTAESTAHDQMIITNKDWVYSRSFINNIVPINNDLIRSNIDQLFLGAKSPLLILGQTLQIPVTTSGLVSLIYSTKKTAKKIELIRILKEQASDKIGYSKKGIVSQDATSTTHLAIVDENLVNCLTGKDYSTIQVGVWFDHESSLISNFFELLLYIAGLSEFQ